jgi:6-carboxyhexanoate--CoA ligase
MQGKNLYSIRMRASAGNRHLSGAERIVAFGNIDATIRDLLARALGKGRCPDEIVVTIDHLDDIAIHRQKALDLITLGVPDARAGRSAASHVLQRAGVSPKAASIALSALSMGAALSGGAMRGAMIMDAQTGERLEPDPERGVRASRFDWSDETKEKIRELLAGIGLTHFRTIEALALATKVAHAPGMVAELCWSDDPDYTAGYVASLTTGYVRFPCLKEQGDEKGGRAYFVRREETDMDSLIRYLQTEAVLIVDPGACVPEIDAEEFVEERVKGRG